MGTVRTFEDLLGSINAEGWWQRLVLLGSMLIKLLGVAFPMYQQNYLLANKMNYFCADDGVTNTTIATGRDECLRADGVTRCESWTYSSDYYESTLVSQFDLVCDRAYLAATYKSGMQMGSLVGLLVWGQVTDGFGRYPVISVLVPLQIVCYFVTSWSGSFWLALAMRGVFGFFYAGSMKALTVLNMEIVPPLRRNHVGVWLSVGFPIGGLLAAASMPLMGGDWRWTHRLAALVSLVALPIVLWLHESPRWLITHEKYARARKVLDRGARLNGERLPDDTDLKALHDAHVVNDRDSRSSILALCSDREMFIRTAAMLVQWLTTSFTFYGVMLYSTDVLPGNPFYKLTLTCFARFLTYPLQEFIMNRVGKKRILLGIWVLGMCALATVATMPSDWGEILPLVLYLFCVLLFDFAFTICYTFTSELFPTVIRSSGLSICSIGGRIGGTAAAFVANLLGAVWQPLPAVFFASSCVLAALCLSLVPEMNNRKLPDTLTDTRRQLEEQREERLALSQHAPAPPVDKLAA